MNYNTKTKKNIMQGCSECLLGCFYGLLGCYSLAQVKKLHRSMVFWSLEVPQFFPSMQVYRIFFILLPTGENCRSDRMESTTQVT